jgi:hypothetical protein
VYYPHSRGVGHILLSLAVLLTSNQRAVACQRRSRSEILFNPESWTTHFWSHQATARTTSTYARDLNISQVLIAHSLLGISLHCLLIYGLFLDPTCDLPGPFITRFAKINWLRIVFGGPSAMISLPYTENMVPPTSSCFLTLCIKSYLPTIRIKVTSSTFEDIKSIRTIRRHTSIG